MSKIDKNLSELFGVEPISTSVETKIVEIIDPEMRAMSVINDPDSTDLEADVAMIRNNLHSLIRNGNEAFEALIHIAKEEEKISAFEVCNSYLSNLAAINMQLMQMHEKKKKIKLSDKKEEKPGSIVNNGGTTNIAFVGTTKEMMEHLKKAKTQDQE